MSRAAVTWSDSGDCTILLSPSFAGHPNQAPSGDLTLRATVRHEVGRLICNSILQKYPETHSDRMKQLETSQTLFNQIYSDKSDLGQGMVKLEKLFGSVFS
ncbi:MAG: hypothetical protein NZO16_05470 [Deltaproteobacteria bacterium]|nr:hypothetical protein [Deltaproteobacteria bacterium]